MTAKTKKTEEIKTSAVKEDVKAVAEVKADAKKTAPATEAKKETSAKKKAAEKPAAEKKAPAKRASCKTAKVVAKIQFAGSEYDIDAITEACKTDYMSKSKTAIKTINLYVKPEEAAAYYVVNDVVSGKIDL